MRRVPIVPSIVVAALVAVMIGLGMWQLLDRLPKKEAYLAQLAGNPARAPVAFPTIPDESLLFRRSSVDCAAPATVRRAGAGAAGFRLIATCATGDRGDPVQIQLGTTRDPSGSVAWQGGEVSGYIGHAPDSRPLIAGLFDSTPAQPMLVAETPPPGLNRNAAPDVSAVPNNHLAYAVQWFVFGGIATIIYVIALRRRNPRP